MSPLMIFAGPQSALVRVVETTIFGVRHISSAVGMASCACTASDISSS